MSDSRVYVGNLPPDCRTKELEDIFYKYGRIRYVDVKKARGPPFAFVEFDDPLDADDAVRGRDGYNFDGYKLKVEKQKGSRGGDGGFRGSRGGGYGGGRGGPPTRRSDYRVIVSGLPPTGSWQDIKDHLRVAGNVCYADVFKDGTGVCEFIRYDDMKYAVKHLDDTKFRSHEGETSYISVKSDYTKRRSSSRSYSRSRSRSRTISASRRVPARRVETERESPSYSPAKRSRSRSRSYDRADHRRTNRRSSHTRSRSHSRHSERRSARKSRPISRSLSRSVSPKRRRSHSRSRTKTRSRSRSSSVNSFKASGNGIVGNGNENGTFNVYHDDDNEIKE